MPNSLRGWLSLPSRIALLLGLGALSAGGAKADTGADAARVPQQSAKSFGDLLVWSEQGRIFIAEAGQPGEALDLGDSPEAKRLLLLLEQEGATATTPGVLRDRVILVGGGGSGAHWPSGRPDAPPQTPTPATTNDGSANAPSPPTGGTANSTVKK